MPPEHPAAGAIVLAVAANVLGLNNAATPLGIKAMEELQTLNPDKDTATNAMVTVHRDDHLRRAADPGDDDRGPGGGRFPVPTAIIAPTVVATFIGTLAAVATREVLQRFYPSTAATVRGAVMIRAALDAISLWAIPVLLVRIPFVGTDSEGQGL